MIHSAAAACAALVVSAASAAVVPMDRGATAPPRRTVPVDAWFSNQQSNSKWGEEIACEGGVAVTSAWPAGVAEVLQRSSKGWVPWQIIDIPGSTGGARSPRIREGHLYFLHGHAGQTVLREFVLDGAPASLVQSIPMPPEDAWRIFDVENDRLVVASGSTAIALRVHSRDRRGSWSDGGISHIVGLPAAWSSPRMTLDADRIALSDSELDAPGAFNAGAVFVALRDETTGLFSLEAAIEPPELQQEQRFGRGIALCDDDLFIGAPGFCDGAGWRRGIVYRYHRGAGGWSLEEMIDSPAPQSFEGFGADLWSDGVRLIVATQSDTPANSVPRAWTFVRDGTGGWTTGAAVDPLILPTGQGTNHRRLDGDGGTLAIVERTSVNPNEWGSVRHLVVLDAAFDCDGNGIDDAIEIHGGVEDCDGNLRPDGCDAGTIAVRIGCNADCDGDGMADWIAISNGLAPDCDGNGVPDPCDVLAGDAADADGNLIPDDCQPDCDGDGVADSVAILAGDIDCDGDGVPNECPHYRSGTDMLHSAPWLLPSQGANTFVHFAQRFVVAPGHETIERIEYLLLQGSIPSSQSDQQVRLCLYRNEDGSGLPFDALPIWFTDAHSGSANFWSSVEVPGVRVGEAGDAFFVVLARPAWQSQGAIGGSHPCNELPAPGCDFAFFSINSSTNGIPMAGALANSAPFGAALDFRVWAGPQCLIGDLDGDGKVDGNDLGALLARMWHGAPPGTAADLDHDFTIDPDDLIILLGGWSP